MSSTGCVDPRWTSKQALALGRMAKLATCSESQVKRVWSMRAIVNI
jgi:hypothetical protein